MIVFRCIYCPLENLSPYVSRCPRCGEEIFAKSEPEPLLQPSEQTTHFSDEPTKPTTEVKFEATGNSSSLNQYNESTGKGFSFSYEDSTNGVGRTDVVSRDSEDADKMNVYSSNIRFGQEQVSRNFSHDLVVRKGILPEIQNTFGHTHSLNALDNDKFNPLRYNFIPDPLFASTTERKHQINFSDPPPSKRCKSGNFLEMMILKQKSRESARIQNIDGEMSFAGPSQFEPHTSMLSSYPESVITNLKSTRNQDNSFSPDLWNKMGNSSNRNIHSENIEIINEVAQQETLTSNPQTRKEGPENACAMLPNNSSDSTSNEGLICGKCLRRFRSEKTLNIHVQNNCDPKPYKCNKCPFTFSKECSLIRHQVVHTGERSFKCNHCEYASYREGNLKRHIDKTHRK